MKIIFMAAAVSLLATPTYPAVYKIETVASGLSWPWSTTFLPSGDYLVSGKLGSLTIVSAAGEKTPVSGLPTDLLGAEDAALPFDVAIDPRSPALFYGCVAHWENASHVNASVEVVRFEMRDAHVSKWTILLEQGFLPYGSGDFWGCRVAVDKHDSGLVVAFGARERGTKGQDMGDFFGKVVQVLPRIDIISRGHRNIEGLALHEGELYFDEHGPQGGDKLGVIHYGDNSGWPEVGHGLGYDGHPVMLATRRDDVQEPLWYWSPSIAPSGLAYYDGRKFADWGESFFVGGLASKALWRLDFHGGHLVGEEKLLAEMNERIRDVREGPDGYLYVLCDGKDGKLIRLVPSNLARGTGF